MVEMCKLMVDLKMLDSQLDIKDRSEHSPFLKASPFRKNTRKTAPHRHNSYLELVFLSAGGGTHTIDQQVYEVRPPVLFFIRHEQVHHWDLGSEAEPDGYVLILKKVFVDNSIDGELKRMLSRIDKLVCVYLEECSVIRQLFVLLASEQVMETGSSFLFAEAILKALFVKILQLAGPSIDRSFHQRDLYQTFTELLTQGRPQKDKVAHYAALLNTTPQNLNAVCRKAADLSAAGVLAAYIVDEAKRMLAYTDQTIAEVAFALSFKDPSHFVKYFKRHTTQTPQAFRARTRINSKVP
jgi:AraC-like DNA-binding protein